MSQHKFWGSCDQVALVLHKLTKAPIVVLYGQRELGEDDDDESNIDEVLIHCGVLIEGRLVDELGPQSSPEVEISNYINMNEPYDYTEVIVCEDLGEFLQLCDACGCEGNSSMIEIEKYIKSCEWFKELSRNF